MWKIQKILKIELCLLLPVVLLAGIVIYKDYSSRPGLIKENTLQVGKRTTDTVNLKWAPVRNADNYVVSYKPKSSDEWQELEVDGSQHKVEVNNLKEGESYDFSLQANSKKRKGVTSDTTESTTKKHQSISGKPKQMKLANNEIDLNLEAETKVKIETENEDVKIDEETQNIEVSQPGTIKLTAIAEENEEFVQEEMELEIEVLDSVCEDTSNASIHTMYKLDKSNCEAIKTVTGSGGADVPQSFGYNEGSYYIAYGMYDTQRIVTYKEDGEKSVSVPKVKLGHPNGFTYSNVSGKGYCVKGWGGRCVVYEPETDKYDVFELPYGASGIAYDRKNKQFYTSSRNLMVAYDENFNVLMTTPAVNHKGNYYTQDCGGHAGIMIRCLSDKSRHGINLIDLYDMQNGKYLGTIECDLSEVESAIVDDEGYMELLCNTTDEKDYIWKTPINIEELGYEKESLNY